MGDTARVGLGPIRRCAASSPAFPGGLLVTRGRGRRSTEGACIPDLVDLQPHGGVNVECNNTVSSPEQTVGVCATHHSCADHADCSVLLYHWLPFLQSLGVDAGDPRSLAYHRHGCATRSIPDGQNRPPVPQGRPYLGDRRILVSDCAALQEPCSSPCLTGHPPSIDIDE